MNSDDPHLIYIWRFSPVLFMLTLRGWKLFWKLLLPTNTRGPIQCFTMYSCMIFFFLIGRYFKPCICKTSATQHSVGMQAVIWKQLWSTNGTSTKKQNLSYWVRGQSRLEGTCEQIHRVSFRFLLDKTYSIMTDCGVTHKIKNNNNMTYF